MRAAMSKYKRDPRNTRKARTTGSYYFVYFVDGFTARECPLVRFYGRTRAERVLAEGFGEAAIAAGNKSA